MNRIYKYKDMIFIEDATTVSGYKRPINAKSMKFLKAGSVANYVEFIKDWVQIGELYKTHIIKDGTLVSLVKKSKSSNATTVNRSISLPISLVERLDKIAEEQERPFSWIIQKLIVKGLGDDKTK